MRKEEKQSRNEGLNKTKRGKGVSDEKYRCGEQKKNTHTHTVTDIAVLFSTSLVSSDLSMLSRYYNKKRFICRT